MKLSWTDVDLLCLKLYDQIKGDEYKPDMIIGVARGGLVPATILASLLKVKDVTCVSIRAYSPDRKLQTPQLLHSIKETLVEGKKVLIVDDIVDTGSSYSLLNEILREYRSIEEISYATLLRRESSLFLTKYCGEVISEDSDWVVFPWESKEE